MKPILCVDFDGVIHSYKSGWQGADVIPDPPVPGAIAFLIAASEHFSVQIYSSRSHQPGGIKAMQAYMARAVLIEAAEDTYEEATRKHEIINRQIGWPDCKPSAFVSIDDRALTFNGTWPSIDELLAFKPWNKR